MPAAHEQAWSDALAQEHLHQRELLATLRNELGDVRPRVAHCPLGVHGVVLRDAHAHRVAERAVCKGLADRHTLGMHRQRWLARLALALLALVAELAGRSLAHRIDVGRQVGPVSYSHAAYYPFLLAGVKLGVALMLARVVWRFAKARRLASMLGRPRMRVELSARLWLVSFLVTSAIYLVQMDAERATVGFGPWLHTSALPVFAVLSVLVAILYRSAELWLHDYEQLAAHAAACMRRLGPDRVAPIDLHLAVAPRRLFGLAFESRPPPVPA